MVDLIHDTITVSVVPSVMTADPTSVSIYGELVSIYGNLDVLSGVYISGDMVFGMKEVDMFSDIPNLSAQNPPFEGLEISEYTRIWNKRIEFNIPGFNTGGTLDIIALNGYGYGTLTANSLSGIYIEIP